MKTLHSTENNRLCIEPRRRVKIPIKQAKLHFEEDTVVDSRNNAFFRYIHNKKHIRRGIGPLKDIAGKLVIDDQNIGYMLNDYYSRDFTPHAEAGYITTNYIIANNEIGSILAT